MAQVDEIRQLVSQSRSRVAKDRAVLQRLARELSYTDQVIGRATLAYNVSLWTLEKFERSQFNLRLSAPNPPPPLA
jgi:predicted nucleic acid-binding protein